MVKESQIWLGGREFFTTLGEVRERDREQEKRASDYMVWTDLTELEKH